MRVTILGGKEDGRSIEIPDGVTTYPFKTYPNKPLTLREMTSPYVDQAVPVKTVVYNVRNVHSAVGRRYRALVEPTLDAWLIKNFTEKGKIDGDR